MNRIITALALSGMFVAAPAFAKTVHKSTVATAGEKAPAGEKAAGGEKTTEAKPEGAAPESAKPAKKTKKSKKAAEKTEGSSEKPAEAPAK